MEILLKYFYKKNELFRKSDVGLGFCASNPTSPDSAQFTVIRYAPRNPKENVAYRPPAVGYRQKSLQSFFLHVCQTKPLRTVSVSSIRQTIRASLSLQIILFFQVSGRGTPYQEVVPQYVIGCMKHLKSLSIRGEEIPPPLQLTSRITE